jgi:hypothetical protein
MLTVKYVKTGRENPSLPPNPQIFDLLELSRCEREKRFQCLSLLRHLRALRRRSKETGGVIPLDNFREQRFLRAHLKEIFTAYRHLRAARVYAFAAYIKNLPHRVR